MSTSNARARCDASPPAPGSVRRLGARAAIATVLTLAIGSFTWLLWLRFNIAPGQPVGLFELGDLAYYYFPMAERTAERLHVGELPLWDANSCSGIPWLAALQVGVFYPGNWLGLWLPVEVAMPMLVLLECGAAGLFMAWLCRAWGGGVFASAVGGVLFIFGCMMGETPWPPVVATICWLP